MDYKTKEMLDRCAEAPTAVLQAVLKLNWALAAALADGWGCAISVEDESGLLAVEIAREDAWPAPQEVELARMVQP